MKDNDFLTVQEVAAVCHCSISTAYKIMRKIRDEMQAEGLITLQGRVPRKRLMERVGLA